MGKRQTGDLVSILSFLKSRLKKGFETEREEYFVFVEEIKQNILFLIPNVINGSLRQPHQ
jgi:hypothetical protein